jgi:hypothetical protein
VRTVQGGRGAILQADGSTKQLLETNTHFEHANYIPIFSLLGEIQNPVAEVQLVSTAGANGTVDDIISVSLIQSTDLSQIVFERQLSRTLFYLNAKSALVDKIEYTLYSEPPTSTAMNLQILYSDYRNVAGVAIPFHQQTLINGHVSSDLQLNSAQLNVGLTDAEFTVPGAVQ